MQPLAVEKKRFPGTGKRFLSYTYQKNPNINDTKYNDYLHSYISQSTNTLANSITYYARMNEGLYDTTIGKAI